MAGSDELDADVQLEQPSTGEPEEQLTAGPVVFILETALSEVNQHAADEPDHEIGGILVGTVTDGGRPVVLVEAAIRGHAMAHSRGSVTFTHETWNEINAIKDSQYPDLRIVGWYHSHPGFGLFLSGHDLFIHQNFFTAPWQVAVVADPLAKSWGCFTWHGKELIQDPAVHTVAVQWSGEGRTAATPADRASQPTPVIISPPAAAPRDRGVTWALGMLGLLVALLIGLVLATYNDVRVIRSQVATLNQQVSGVSRELTSVRDRVLDLSPQTETAAPPSTDTTRASARFRRWRRPQRSRPEPRHHEPHGPPLR